MHLIGLVITNLHLTSSACVCVLFKCKYSKHGNQ